MTQRGEGEPGPDSCPQNLLCGWFITLVIHAQACFPASSAHGHSLWLTINLTLGSRGVMFWDNETLQSFPDGEGYLHSSESTFFYQKQSTAARGSRKSSSPGISQISDLLPARTPASCIHFGTVFGVSSPQFPTTQSCCAHSLQMNKIMLEGFLVYGGGSVPMTFFFSSCV